MSRYVVHVNGSDAEQLPRLAVFQSNYPRWAIGYDQSRDLWRAHRVIGTNGGEEHVRWLLRELLDKLESLPDVLDACPAGAGRTVRETLTMEGLCKKFS